MRVEFKLDDRLRTDTGLLGFSEVLQMWRYFYFILPRITCNYHIIVGGLDRSSHLMVCCYFVSTKFSRHFFFKE